MVSLARYTNQYLFFKKKQLLYVGWNPTQAFLGIVNWKYLR